MVILYGVNLSTFTRKVRLALAEKSLEYRLEPTPMGSTKVRTLHPLGKIPVIEDAGHVIPDSSVIIAYLERTYPQVPLYPADAGLLAKALWLEEYADTRLREATVPYFLEHVVKPVFQGKPGDESALAKAEPLRDESFNYLEGELSGAVFASGNQLSVADLALGAQLITYQQGAGEIATGRWPKLERYFAGLRQRPCWAALITEERETLQVARARRAATAS